MAHVLPLVEYDARIERAKVLQAVLERRLIWMAEGRKFNWNDLMVGMTIAGQPVSAHNIRVWRKTPWGREIEENLKVEAQETIQEALDGSLAKAVQDQLDIATDATAAPKAKPAAFLAVWGVAKDIGYVQDRYHEQAAKPPDITILMPMFADPIALARNVTASPQLTNSPPEPNIIEGTSKSLDQHTEELPK